MNQDLVQQFRMHVNRLLQPVIASPRRKRIMQDELLAHVCEAYTEEHGSHEDEQLAATAAWKRLGEPEGLRRELQMSVPMFERILFRYLGQPESYMSRILLVIGVIALVVGMNVSFAYRDEVQLGAMILITGLVLLHLYQKDNLASRWLGPRWPWLVGLFAIFFGPAIILPALAKLKRDGIHGPVFVMAISLGMLITLSGVGFIAYAFRSWRARTA